MSGYDLIWFCIYGGLAVLIVGFIVFLVFTLFKFKKLNKRLTSIESKLDLNNNSQSLKSRLNADFTYKTLDLLDIIASNVMKDTISKKRKEIYSTLIEKIREIKKDHKYNDTSNDKVIVKVNNKKRRLTKDEKRQLKQQAKKNK